jgi:hypothetical protein
LPATSAQAGKTLQASVATTSESIMPNSRTLLVELYLDDPNNDIQPGKLRANPADGWFNRSDHHSA